MIKSELRHAYMAKRRSLTPDELAVGSEKIAQNFFDNTDLRDVSLLHCFIPIDRFNEIDTTHILDRLWRDFPDVKTLAPRMGISSSGIESVIFHSFTELVPNQWGIREPTQAEQVPASMIDMVLVPLLCFDTKGQRVGYGKGFYDRFLSKCRADCSRIGLSYFPPVTAIDDVGPHDVALELIVTPTELFVPRI